MGGWTFITGHGTVLLIVAKYNKIKASDIALQTGMAERSVWRILHDLEHAGYIIRKKEGRSNIFEINHDLPLRRPEMRDSKVKGLIEILGTK